MEDDFKLIFSTSHGKLTGSIIEPLWATDLPDDERCEAWKVRIGPFTSKQDEFPKDDFNSVVHDVLDYLEDRGITPPSALMPIA